MKRFFAALVACSIVCGAAYADGTLDGIIGSNYGAPYGTDAVGDASNGHAILDCRELYLYDSGPGTDVFIAMRVGGNIVSTNWGKYMFFVETNNATPKAGIGNGNGWGRPIQGNGSSVNPSHWIGSWVDSGGGWELYKFAGGTTWNRTNASYDTPGGGGFVWTTDGTSSTLEYRIPRALFNTPLPTTVKVIGMSSGGGAGDNAQDSVPSSTPGTNQANAGDWGSMVTMTQTQLPFSVPVTVSGFSID
ncbi:MAG: hypothetical protein N2111_01715 [Candidatus Sumerlaeaceae bacterium]|nr:hypothetical protein [Candidatus Sumerlaeaceae bacterium]